MNNLKPRSQRAIRAALVGSTILAAPAIAADVTSERLAELKEQRNQPMLFVFGL